MSDRRKKYYYVSIIYCLYVPGKKSLFPTNTFSGFSYLYCGHRNQSQWIEIFHTYLERLCVLPPKYFTIAPSVLWSFLFVLILVAIRSFSLATSALGRLTMVRKSWRKIEQQKKKVPKPWEFFRYLKMLIDEKLRVK